MNEVKEYMKRILMRLVNLLTVLAVVILCVWFYEIADVMLSDGERYVSYEGFYATVGVLCITLAANYVFFGRLTLWNRTRDETSTSQQ
jgi:hypothetical protein